MPIAKKTAKNQITLPRSVVDRFPDVEYFDMREADGQIILRPVRPNRAEEVRKKLAELGIAEDRMDEDRMDAAIRWARRRSR